MSVWGVAKPLPTPLLVTAGADVAVPSATATTVLTSAALAALDNGDYYPLVLGVVAILIGATAPTALIITGALGANAAFDSFAVAVADLVALATLMIPLALLGVNSRTALAGAGQVVNIAVTATGQAVTFKAVGSRVICAAFVGPDV